jgi:8-oxo-dGTP pyrophosphatase MutT (NUDIX family)
MSSPKFKKIYCGNCGKNGHIYKDCMEPITSLGIIGYKFFNDKIKYILIQRKHSYGYVDFIRGKYDINNINYINQLFGEMSKYEIEKIFSYKFIDLWKEIWGDNKILNDEYKLSLEKFEEIIDIKYSLKLDSKWDSPEWGFPKGRRNINESNKYCAIREFCEETNLKSKDIKILNNIYPISEIFVGSNNIRYKHIYYVAESLTELIEIDANNDYQTNEIGKIGWFSLIEAEKMFREYNFEKIKILKKLEKQLSLNQTNN